MENEGKRATSSKSTSWIECESKSRPGMKYLFNPATKECKWLKEPTSPEKPSRALAAPAKERLKRLQAEFQKPEKKCDTKGNKSRPQKMPPTKKATAAVAYTTPKDRLKMLQSQAIKDELKKATPETTHANPKTTVRVESETRKSIAQGVARKAVAKSRCSAEPMEKSATNTNTEFAFTSPKDRLKILQNKPVNFKNKSQEESLKKIASPESGTLKRVNQVQTPILNKPQPSKAVKYVSSARKAYSGVAPKTIPKRQCSTEPVVERSETKLESAFSSPKDRLKVLQDKAVKDNFKSKPPEAKIKKILPPQPETPKKVNEVPKQIFIKPQSSKPANNKSIFEKFSNIKDPKSRNDAITKLKRSLKETSQTDETTLLDLKFLTETTKNSKPLKRLECSANKRLERFRKELETENTVVEQQFTPQSVNSYPEDEAMDWEPIEEPNDNGPTFNSPTFNNNVLDDVTEMEVDENLMLNAAEELQVAHKLKEKWLRGFIYVVLDTNVFIDHLSFIKLLQAKEFNHGVDLVLYIPYLVLQELDKLKVRRDIRSSVVSAIRFLNKVFEEKSDLIQAQSAIEERNHIINVQSADDSILNCCFQVKEHIPNVILLTEDMNLRNKAICNDIQTSTAADLLKKPFNAPQMEAFS